ncbi:UNVERIFIED_CONTAM: hypothetical protein Slati_2877200 [Sesamum latifolium]|uniref:Uncharacterized protein n=1 Tax=Sesamum latifolium TaxID=2727402 RepID=A0AAW2VBX9_9LAMI
MHRIRTILKKFEQPSGLVINSHKSVVVFSKHVEERLCHELAGILDVSIVPKHEKYLGLPTVAGRSKKELFGVIKERIWHKLNNWSSRKLSQMGRVVLIKSVLQTIPTYVMSCFCLPDSILSEIESVMASFFWNYGEVAKVHWLSCPKLCKTCKEGVMGFQRLRDFKSALLAKQAWRALNPGGIFHSILKQKYFPQSSFVAAELEAAPSYTWNSMWSTQDLLAAGIRWKTGDETSFQMMGQHWLPRSPTFQPVQRPISFSPEAKVA